MSKLLLAALAATITDPAAAGYLDQPDDYLDELITLRQAAGELPRRRAGRKCALQTLYRWTGPHGCKGIVLRSTQVGCCRVTTRRWLGEFFGALARQRRGETLPSGAPAGPTPTLTSRTPAQRRRANEAAERELERLGV